MHISSQLATAHLPSASRSTTAASDNATGFHEALQTAAANGRTAATANDKTAPPAQDTTATAASNRGEAGGNTSSTVANGTPGPTLLAGKPSLAGTIAPEAEASVIAETSAPALDAQAAAGHVVSKKGKPASSSADGSADPASAGLAAPAGTDPSALTIASTNPIAPAPGTPGTDGGASAPVEVQGLGTGVPGSLIAALPATAGGEQGLAGRGAVGAPGGGFDLRSASTSSEGPVLAVDANPAAETIPSAGGALPASPGASGAEQIPNPLAAVAIQQNGTPAVPPNLTSAGGKDRLSAGEVRGKRKDTAANGSAPERASISATPSPFAAKLVQAQAPAQAGADDGRSADPAGLQKVLDGSQSLPTTHTPASTETTAGLTGAAQTAAAPSASATPADVSAEAAAIPGASSAQLIQSAGQTEMRLGMRSAEFGNISISTSVSHQAISAQISLDHAELGRALAVHLPAIEEKLGAAYGLHARVEVRDESAASRSANDSGQRGGAYQDQTGGARGGGQGSNGAGIAPVSEPGTGSAGAASVAASLAVSGVVAASARLDVRV